MSIKKVQAEGVLILPQLDLWSGRRHLTMSEIGIDLPKGLATPGSKRVFDPAAIQPLATIKSKTMTAIEKVAVKYGRGAYCTSESQMEELVPTLDAYNADFDALKDELDRNYDRLFDEWVNTLDQQWQPIISAAKVARSDAVTRYNYRYSILQIQAPSARPDANNAMIGGLRGQLWNELSTIARHALEHLQGKAKVSQKGKSPIRRIAEKAQAVSFIDPRATSLAGYLDAVHDQLPKTGPIEGHALDTIRVLMHDLSQESRAIELAEKFGGPVVVDEDVDDVDADNDEAESLVDGICPEDSAESEVVRYW